MRRAGLSATLGPEITAACRWLRPSQPESVRVIEDTEKKSIQLRISGYLRHPCRKSQTDDKEASEDATVLEGDFVKDVFDAFHGKTALVFANAKSFHRAARRLTPEGNLRVADCLIRSESTTAPSPRESERKRKRP